MAVYLDPPNFKHIGDGHTIADQINEVLEPHDLACIEAWRACQGNQRVLFTTAMDMLNEWLASQVDHSLVRKLSFYTDPTLLLID